MSQTIQLIKNDANRDIFDSIFTLYECERKNCTQDYFFENISDSDTNTISIYSVDPDAYSITFRIGGTGRPNDVTYVLTEGYESDDGALGFYRDGAAWFEKLRRGEQMDSPDSSWAGMRDLVARAYHRKYFTIEYLIENNLKGQECMEECETFVKALQSTVYGSLTKARRMSPLKLREAALGETEDVYYCAKLKVDATLGVGEAIPLIGRVYYKLSGGQAHILPRSQAFFLDRGLNLEDGGGPLRSGGVVKGESETRRLINTIKNSLSEDLNGDDADEKFTSGIIFSEGSKKILSEQNNKATVSEKNGTVGKDTLELECKGIKLVNVAKIMWPNLRYFVMSGSRRLFELNYNINGIMLRCSNCDAVCGDGNEDLLIENNEFVFPDGVKHARWTVYPVKEDGTFDKSEKAVVEQLEKFAGSPDFGVSNISRHLFAEPSCGRLSEGGIQRCMSLVCDCQIVGEEGKGHCRNCPYPEVVYFDPDTRESFSTADMYYDLADGKMRLRGSGVKACGACGRLSEKLSGGLCETCRRASGKETDEGKELYRRYRRLLGLGTRITALGKKRVCYENREMIIFGIGDDLYGFNKADIPEKGYVPTAKKIMKRDAS